MTRCALFRTSTRRYSKTDSSFQRILLLFFPLQVNHVAVWYYDPAVPPSPSSSSTSLIEPQCECEVEVAGDVMDMQFLDEERIVVCLSTGSVALLRFRPAHKVLYGRGHGYQDFT